MFGCIKLEGQPLGIYPGNFVFVFHLRGWKNKKMLRIAIKIPNEKFSSVKSNISRTVQNKVHHAVSNHYSKQTPNFYFDKSIWDILSLGPPHKQTPFLEYSLFQNEKSIFETITNFTNFQFWNHQIMYFGKVQDPHLRKGCSNEFLQYFSHFAVLFIIKSLASVWT